VALHLYHYWLVFAYLSVAGAPVLRPSFLDTLDPTQQGGPVSPIKDIKQSRHRLNMELIMMCMDGLDQKVPNTPLILIPTPMSRVRIQINLATM